MILVAVCRVRARFDRWAPVCGVGRKPGTMKIMFPVSIWQALCDGIRYGRVSVFNTKKDIQQVVQLFLENLVGVMTSCDLKVMIDHLFPVR